MTTVTWYAFEDPKTKREYYFEPVSNKTTWTLPTSSTTPVKMAGGATPASIPASPMSIAGDIFSQAGIKMMNDKTRGDGSSNKRGFGKRAVVVTIGTILFLNTLCLGILVKVMYTSSVADVDPISESKIVPSNDNVRLEPVDVDSGEVAEDMALPEDDVSTHDVHTENINTEAPPVAAEEEVKVIESNKSEPAEEEVMEEAVSVKDDDAETEAIVSDSSSSSENEKHVETEAIVSDSFSSSDDTISKRLTRDKIFSVITPVIPIIIGYGAARIAFALVARVALILSPPAAPIVVAQATGPMSIIKAFVERFLGGPSPAAVVVKDPTLFEKIANMVAKLLKLK
mmetsp:Transcript_11313/g.16798  ORF Transcript_11313/g.16798 Transcript_11313/m.16798 type:complete len:342 (-) Transcript_11313:1275-2300(-)